MTGELLTPILESMNRKPDGTLLTKDDLFDIAVRDGADADKLSAVLTSLHGDAAQRSHLLFLTREARFLDRTLKLDTRAMFTPSPPKGDTVLLDFFLAKRKEA